MCCFPRARVLLTAPTNRQVREVLWGELSRLVRQAKIPLGGHLAKTPAGGFRFDDGREIIGFSTDKAENIAGYSGPHVLWVVDEASGFDERLFQAIEGNAQSGARIFIISNPTRTAGFFFDAFHSRASEWERFQISAEEAAQYAHRLPGLSEPDTIAAQIKRLGRAHAIVRVRILGDFPSAAADAVVSLDLVERGHERWLETVSEALEVHFGTNKPSKITANVLAQIIGPEHGELELGVDVARFGDDDTVITPRRGKFCFPQIIVHGLDSNEVGAACIAAIQQHRAPHERAKVKVDGIGFGSGVVDRLRQDEFQEYCTVFDINVSERSDEEDQYPNLRSQLCFAVNDYLEEGGTLPPADGDEEGMLDAELMTPVYKFDGKARRVVESKAEIKKRLGRSPDRSDSYALAIYRQVKPLRQAAGDRRASAGGSRFGEGRGF